MPKPKPAPIVLEAALSKNQSIFISATARSSRAVIQRCRTSFDGRQNRRPRDDWLRLGSSLENQLDRQRQAARRRVRQSSGGMGIYRAAACNCTAQKPRQRNSLPGPALVGELVAGKVGLRCLNLLQRLRDHGLLVPMK